MANNYFSNVAQNALNNMNPNSLFNQNNYSSFFKPPTTGTKPLSTQNQSNSSTQDPNVIYSNKGQGIASKAPVSTGSSSTVSTQPKTTTIKSPWPTSKSTTSYSTGTSSTIPTVNTPVQYSPQSYADQLNKAYTGLGELQQKRGILSQAPLGQFNVGSRADDVKQYQTGLLAAESKPYEQQINAANIGLQAALPKTIGPTDYAYNPLGGASEANTGAGSAFARQQRSGALGYASQQGAQQGQLEQSQNTITGIKRLIGNDSITGITAIDAIIGDVRNQVPNAKIQDFRAKLGALAQQVSSYNPSVAAQLTNFAGNGLGTASGTNIMAAINAAQQSIQEQQNAIPNYNGGGNTSGSTGGIYAESWTL